MACPRRPRRPDAEISRLWAEPASRVHPLPSHARTRHPSLLTTTLKSGWSSFCASPVHEVSPRGARGAPRCSELPRELGRLAGCARAPSFIHLTCLSSMPPVLWHRFLSAPCCCFAGRRVGRLQQSSVGGRVHGGLLGGFRLAKIQKLEAPLLLLLPIMAAAAAACYRTAAARPLAGSAAPAAGTVTRCCCCSARGALWVASFVFGGRVHHHHHHHHPRGREAVAGAGRLFSSVTTWREVGTIRVGTCITI